MDIIKDIFKPYIFLSGEGLLVEGTVRLCLWQKDCIILKSGDKIKISGEELKLEHRGCGTVLVQGKIRKLEFLPC